MAGNGQPIKELAGQRFGRLTALSLSRIVHGKGAQWTCRCDCGQVCDKSGTHLRSGKTRSCGCLRSEKAASTKTTHGLSKKNSRAYSTWQAMRRRCTNTTHRDYPHYGGRGVSVCERWASFADFLADMGEPKPGQTIDRIDVNGDYEPGNCRWASRQEQSNNRRVNVVIQTATGSRCMAEFARQEGISYSSLRRAIKAGRQTINGKAFTTHKQRTET